MKGKILFISMVLLLAMSLVASSCAPEEAPTPTVETPPPFKVGAIFWKAGELMEFTEGQLGCVNLAAKEINEQGGILDGRMVEVLWYDEGFSAEVALASVKKAVADGCEAIIGFQDATTAQPAHAYCKEKGIILTIGGAGGMEITETNYPGSFRAAFMDQANGRALGRWVEDMGFKTVVYLAVDSAYCIQALDFYRETWDQPGGVELLDVIWIPYGATECKMETAKAVSYNPDFLYTDTWGDSIFISIAETIDELGYENPWTVCYDCMMPKILAELGPLADGSWHAFSYLPDPDVPESWRFYQDFKEMNPDASMHGFAEASYEGMMCMLKAIDAAGGVDDLEAYDEALMAIDWVTPRGVKIEILPNRENFMPEWSVWYREGGEWTNPMPMKLNREDFFVK